MPIHENGDGEGRLKLRNAVSRNRQLVLEGRALASELDQGLAALKDEKAQLRANRPQNRELQAGNEIPKVTNGRRRILLVEDHPVVSRGLKELINLERDLEVVDVADTSKSALEKLDGEEPDLVILDLTLGEHSGLDLLKEIRTRNPEQRVLILSLHDEVVYAPRALRAGALGYVMKHEDTQTLLCAVRKVLEDSVYLSPRLEANVREHMLKGNSALHPLETLSDRELEVFRLLGRGVSNRDIAQLLDIRLKTVESHRTHIKQKLHLSNATELLQYAIQHQKSI